MRMKIHEIMTALYALERRGAVYLPDLGFMATQRAAESLRSCAGRLSRIAESECNGIQRYDAKAGRVLASWNEQDQARADRLTAKAESEAREAVAAIFGDSVAVTFQGDPRGAPIRLWIGAPSESSEAAGYVY